MGAFHLGGASVAPKPAILPAIARGQWSTVMGPATPHVLNQVGCTDQEQSGPIATCPPPSSRAPPAARGPQGKLCRIFRIVKGINIINQQSLQCPCPTCSPWSASFLHMGRGVMMSSRCASLELTWWRPSKGMAASAIVLKPRISAHRFRQGSNATVWHTRDSHSPSHVAPRSSHASCFASGCLGHLSHPHQCACQPTCSRSLFRASEPSSSA